MTTQHAKSNAREGDGVAVTDAMLEAACARYFGPGGALGFPAREMRAALEAAMQAQQGADGVALIAAERQRQVSAEGWTPEHDDEHFSGQLAVAAACYAAPELSETEAETGTRPRMAILAHWPWALSWWKPGDRIRELTKAGALIAAEIDRLQRAGAPR